MTTNVLYLSLILSFSCTCLRLQSKTDHYALLINYIVLSDCLLLLSYAFIT